MRLNSEKENLNPLQKHLHFYLNRTFLGKGSLGHVAAVLDSLASVPQLFFSDFKFKLAFSVVWGTCL